jgi:alpha-tubulin suppressor-like RCC1 family protein
MLAVASSCNGLLGIDEPILDQGASGADGGAGGDDSGAQGSGSPGGEGGSANSGDADGGESGSGRTGGSAGSGAESGSGGSSAAGGDPGAGGAVGSGGITGSAGTLGSGGGAGTGGPGPGDPCDEPDALACDGAAQRRRLRCEDGEWVGNGTCGSGDNCDSPTGTCLPIVANCDGRAPGHLYCDTNEVRRCGPDLVTSISVEACGVGPVCRDRTEGAACMHTTFLAAGLDHTCAVSNLGTLKCWGSSASGQLGYGNTNTIGDTETPATVAEVDVGGTVEQVATGNSHTCALLTSGNVRCWGEGDSGRLGYGDIDDIGIGSPILKENVDVGGPVKQLTAGALHSCALLETGTLRCWGSGTDGRLGYNDTNPVGASNTPNQAGDVPVGGLVAQVDAGTSHTCAVLTNNKVRCWGIGSFGRLGYGNTNNVGDNVARTIQGAGDVAVGGLDDQASEVVAAGTHTCARLVSGSVRCWGVGTSGRLGYVPPTDGIVGNDEVPSTQPLLDLGVGSAAQLSARVDHTCALVTVPVGGVRCWGEGNSGRLGHDDTTDVQIPTSVSPVSVGEQVVQVAAGGAHSCALLTNGAVRCWGAGGLGALGYGDMANVGDGDGPLPSVKGDVSVW